MIEERAIVMAGIDGATERYVEAVGAAGAAVDIARISSDHVARRVVLAVAAGGLEHPDPGPALLRTLAVESEMLARDAAALGARYDEWVARATAALDGADAGAQAEAIAELESLEPEGALVRARAEGLGRRLPPVAGDAPPHGVGEGDPSADDDVVDMTAARERRGGDRR